MARVCDLCGKRRNKANKVCFSNKHHRHFQEVNLQPCRVAMPNGSVVRMRICTGCIRANKVRRAA
jgi:large subunit ribosomal protein L28